MDNLTIAEVLKQYKDETLNVQDLWFDWFCGEDELEDKGNELLRRLDSIADSSLFDKNKTYVFFKNNCPCGASLYDSMSICDIESGKVLYYIVPCSTLDDSYGLAEVYDIKANSDEPAARGSWFTIEKYFYKEKVKAEV